MFRKSKQKQNYPFLLRNTAILLLVITAFLIIQNIGCYKGHGLSPQQGIGIRGRITFTGTPPDSTKEIWIAVLKKYPHGITDINQIFMFVISNLVVSDSIPSNVTMYDYELEITSAGQYEWVLVIWFPDQEDYLFGAKELGAYYANPDDPFPTPIDIPKNVIVEGIDIKADFNNIYNDFPFYKKKQ